MQKLHEKYLWSYKAEYDEKAHSIVFRAGAKPRAEMTEAPSKDDPDYEAFELMCAEWHTSVAMFREILESEGFKVRHSIGEINSTLATEEFQIFEDVLTFPDTTDMSKVYEVLEHHLLLINEVVDFINNEANEVQAATS